MPQRIFSSKQRILLVLLALGLVVAACAPAATQDPASIDAPSTVTETADEDLPDVPELTPREPGDEAIDEDAAVADELAQEPTGEEPTEEEPTGEEPAGEDVTTQDPMDQDPMDEEAVDDEMMDDEMMDDEDAVETTPEMALPGDEPIRIAINVGGDEVEAAGMTWVADQFFEGGRTTANAAVADIEGADDAAIYLSARTAEVDLEGFRYSIPVPAEGIYEVRLHFAELYWGAPGAGEEGGVGNRVFNVSFEGGTVELSGIDLAAEAGSMSAVVKAFEVPVEGSTLDIDFGAVINRPLVSAIEVFGPIMQGN